MIGDACRDVITAYLDVGYRLEQVETELIDRAVGLSEDERAALWLYAWAYQGLLSDGVAEPALAPA